ncbi:MAG: hypothetical protein K9L28_00795 [Synergistales bacterium]|nr:hypothetical protein [Synergistales bacterium]
MWLWGCLTPHPPIIVPDVGRGREQESKATVQGMQELADRTRDAVPDTAVILTPHHRLGKGLHCIVGDSFAGDLAQFGAPEAGINAECSPGVARRIHQTVGEAGLPVSWEEKPRQPLDHAAIIPLYYFQKGWKQLPKLVLANPLGLNPEEAFQAGKALAPIGETSSLALIASGDLSHRLTYSAPAGFSPVGKQFDEAVCQAIRDTSPDPLFRLSTHQLEEAAECGLRSVLMLLGLAQGLGETMELLSYEGPFGVGYCTALWKR